MRNARVCLIDQNWASHFTLKPHETYEALVNVMSDSCDYWVNHED